MADETAKVLKDIAAIFEIYASDQLASKRWQKPSGKKVCDTKAEIWNDAAAELRGIAERHFGPAKAKKATS